MKCLAIFLVLLLVINSASSRYKNNIKNVHTSENDSSLTCSNSILGFDGMCLSDASKILENVFPNNVRANLENTLFPIINQVATSNVGDFCIGDYTGLQLEKDKNLREFPCGSFPVGEKDKFGVLTTFVENVPCPKPVTVSACVMFDNCGTFALAINGNSIGCVVSTTVIGAILQPLLNAIDIAQIGFSLQRRFEQEFSVLVRHKNDMEVRKIKTRGHFFFGLNLALPFDFIKFGKKSLKDVFNLNVESTYMIDLGVGLGDTMKGLVDTITNGKPDKNLLNNIMKIGSDISIDVKGKLSIKLSKMTFGFLRDFELDLGESSVYVTRNVNGNTTGLDAGVYFYFKSDILKNLKQIVKKIIKDFGPIVKGLGFVEKAIPNATAHMGFFMTKKAIGISFGLSGNTIKCMFIYKKKKGSCSFNSAIFTAIINGAKWVIKKAKALLDTSGKKIVSFAKDAGKFAESAAKEVAKKSEELARKAAKEAEKASKEVADAAVKGAKSVEKVGKSIAKKAEKVGKSIGKALSKWKK